MIEFPLEVGILCWGSTIILAVVIVVAVWKIVKAILDKKG